MRYKSLKMPNRQHAFTLTAESAVYYRARGGASVWHRPRNYYTGGGGATAGVIPR